MKERRVNQWEEPTPFSTAVGSFLLRCLYLALLSGFIVLLLALTNGAPRQRSPNENILYWVFMLVTFGPAYIVAFTPWATLKRLPVALVAWLIFLFFLIGFFWISSTGVGRWLIGVVSSIF